MPRKSISEEELNIAIKLYNNGLSLTKVAELLERDRNYLAKKFNEKGIDTKHAQHNKKYFNNKFFDEWNEKSAYWLGFIFADGHLSEKNSLEVCIKDKEHIEKFKTDIEAEHKISTRIVSGYAYYRLTIQDPYMANRLRELGVMHNKTYGWKIPNIPKEFMHHFIRGVFDGDGSFSLSSRRKTKGDCKWSIVSYSFQILEDIKNAIINTSTLKEDDIHIYNNKNRVPSLNIFKIDSLKKIFDYIYKDATVYLDRKYNKYLEYCRLRIRL